MAKKQFNFRQTLKKKDEAAALPKKVALPKSRKDPDAIKQQVAEIHGDPEPAKPAPKAAAKEPTPKKDTVSRKTEPAAPERQVRITIDMPASLHKAMKIKAITDNTTIRRYILTMIEKDLKRG